MTCSGIDDDDEYRIYALSSIAIRNKIETWFGREIQKLDLSNCLLDKDITALIPSPSKKLIPFYERSIKPIADDWGDEDGTEWLFAPAQSFVQSYFSDNMTVEQILAQKDMAFDTQLGDILQCKSLWHRARTIGREVKKGCKRAYKKTSKFVKEKFTPVITTVAPIALGSIGIVKESQFEHPKSTAERIKKVAKIVAIVAAVAIAVYVVVQAAPAIAAGGKALYSVTAAALAKLLNDLLDKREKPGDGSHITVVSQPSYDSYDSTSPSDLSEKIDIPEFIEKYKNDTSLSPSLELSPNPSAPSKSSFGTYLENVQRNQIGSCELLPPEMQFQFKNPPEPTPQPKPSPPIKSDYGAHLEQRQLSAINPNYLPSLPHQHKHIDPSHHQPLQDRFKLIEAPTTSKSALASIVDALREGLQIIGEGINRESGDSFDFHSMIDPLQQTLHALPEEDPKKLLETIRDTLNQSLETLKREADDLSFLDFQENTGIQPKTFQIKNVLTKLFESLGNCKNIVHGSEMFMGSPVTPDLAQQIASLPLPEKSRRYKIEGAEMRGKCVTYINGMNNTLEFSMGNAKYVQSLSSNNIAIQGVYSQTNGIIRDGLEATALNFNGISPNTAELLRAVWTEFHVDNLDRPDAKIMHFCHSKGGPDTVNALKGLPENIRNRIIVVAIASAEYIPADLCHQSFNYASEKDIVPVSKLVFGTINAVASKDFVEFKNLWENQQKIIYLKPNEDASFFDHEFQSKTFTETIRQHLKEYILNNEEIK